VRQVVLDTETTGLEVANGHRIIEIGAVELVNRRLTGRNFS
jgi:DNA polymerase-3 subunit epsilon